MLEDLTWTGTRPLTFFGRMRLTFILFWLRLPMPAAWLVIVWRSGTVASSRLIDPRRVRLRIESVNGNYVDVTIRKKQVTSP